MIGSPPASPSESGPRPHPIRVDVDRDPDRTVLRVAGEIDILTAGELQRPLRAALAAGRPLTLDLADVVFIDSTGLRLLLETRGRAPHATGDELELVLGSAHPVRRLLDLTGVLDLFRIA